MAQELPPHVWKTLLYRSLAAYQLDTLDSVSTSFENDTGVVWRCTLTLSVPQEAVRRLEKQQPPPGSLLAPDGSLLFTDVGDDTDKKKSKRVASEKLLKRMIPFAQQFRSSWAEFQASQPSSSSTAVGAGTQPSKGADMFLNEALQRLNLIGRLKHIDESVQRQGARCRMILRQPWDIDVTGSGSNQSAAEGDACRALALRLGGCPLLDCIDVRLWARIRALPELIDAGLFGKECSSDLTNIGRLEPSLLVPVAGRAVTSSSATSMMSTPSPSLRSLRPELISLFTRACVRAMALHAWTRSFQQFAALGDSLLALVLKWYGCKRSDLISTELTTYVQEQSMNQNVAAAFDRVIEGGVKEVLQIANRKPFAAASPSYVPEASSLCVKQFNMPLEALQQICGMTSSVPASSALTGGGGASGAGLLSVGAMETDAASTASTDMFPSSALPVVPVASGTMAGWRWKADCFKVAVWMLFGGYVDGSAPSSHAAEQVTIAGTSAVTGTMGINLASISEVLTILLNSGSSAS